MANELDRYKKKLLAVRRAERRLKHRLDDIDYEYDVLMPEIERLTLEASNNLELVEFIVEDEN